MMQGELGYGKGTVAVDCPDDWEVAGISKARMPILDDAKADMLSALKAPVDAAPLATAAKGCPATQDVERAGQRPPPRSGLACRGRLVTPSRCKDWNTSARIAR